MYRMVPIYLLFPMRLRGIVHCICILGYSDYDVFEKIKRVPLIKFTVQQIYKTRPSHFYKIRCIF
jgi:hypothetical protein